MTKLFCFYFVLSLGRSRTDHADHSGPLDRSSPLNGPFPWMKYWAMFLCLDHVDVRAEGSRCLGLTTLLPTEEVSRRVDPAPVVFSGDPVPARARQQGAPDQSLFLFFIVSLFFFHTQSSQAPAMDSLYNYRWPRLDNDTLPPSVPWWTGRIGSSLFECGPKSLALSAHILCVDCCVAECFHHSRGWLSGLHGNIVLDSTTLVRHLVISNHLEPYSSV